MSLVLDDTTKSIEVSLGGAVTTNELEWTTHYADYTTGSFVPANNHGVTAGAGDVAMVAAPAAATQRLIQNMTVYNADTVSADVTIKLDDPGVERRLVGVTLPVGYSLHFKEDMWQVLSTDGAIVYRTGGAATHNILSAAHGDAATDVVSRGSIIYGNANIITQWDELVIGAAAQHLESDGTDITWQTNIVMADGATIGQAAGPLITFDDTGDDLEIRGCVVVIGETATPDVRLGQRLDAAVSANYGGASLSAWTTTAAQAPLLDLKKSAHATIGTHAAVSQNDLLGMLNFRGSDGVEFLTGARLSGYVDGPVTGGGADDMPGRFVFSTTPDGSGSPVSRLTIDKDGHTFPNSSKTQDLGLTGSEWDDLWWVTSHQGTSRLVDSTRMCPVCNKRMRRSTGTSVYLGDDRDYALVFCTDCGNMGVEEWQHLTEADFANRRPAPKIIFEGVRVKPGVHGRQVALDYRYGDDVLDEETGSVIQQAVRNSTRLGELELVTFMAMSKSERLNFIRSVGEREWYVREESRLMKKKAAALEVEVASKVAAWVGKDLLKEAK